MDETGRQAASLSADELKSQLYHKFQKKGILDNMRAQLRNRLVTELNTGTTLMSANAAGDKQTKTPLIVQVTNWLIAEHLRKHDYTYTLSVFVSESRTLTNTEDMFSLEDILQLLRIDPKSKLYQALRERSEQEALGSILCHILRLLDVDLGLQDSPARWREDQCIQTENKFQMSVTYTFQEKLQQVEDLYYLKKGARRIESEGTVEGHLLKYQQHIEEKVRKEAKDELDTFKNRELLTMKHKEQEKFRREFDIRRREMEKEYRIKVDSLCKREKKHMKDIEELREKLEYDTFKQRQEILSQLDSVRQKELEARRLAEMYRSESNVNKEQLKGRKEKLKIREHTLQERESALDRLVTERALRERLEEQQQHVNKMAELQQEEVKLTAMKKEVENQKEIYELKLHEANNAVQKTRDLELAVSQLQASETFLKQQNQRLNEEIRELDECRGAKSEASMLRQEVDSLQRSVQNVIADREHLSRLVQELKEQLVQPSPQVVALKRELEQEQDARRLDKAISQDQRSRYESELTTALERNKALSLRLEQQMLLAQQVQMSNRDLRDQLRSAYAFTGVPHQGERLPAPSLVKQRSQPNLSTLNDENPSAFFDTSLNASQIPPELELQGRMVRDFDLLESVEQQRDSYIPISQQPKDLTFLHQSQCRLRSLEREAELLEQQYREFHQRQLNKMPPLSSRFDQRIPSFSAATSTLDTKYSAYQHGTRNIFQNTPQYRRPDWTPNAQYEHRTAATVSQNVLPSQVTTSSIKRNYQIVSDTDTFNWSYSNMPKATSTSPLVSNVKETEALGEDSPLHSTLLNEDANDNSNGVEDVSKAEVGEEETFEFTTHFYAPPTVESEKTSTKLVTQKKLSFDDNPSYVGAYKSRPTAAPQVEFSDVSSLQHPQQTSSISHTVINMSVSKSLPKLDLDSTWKSQEPSHATPIAHSTSQTTASAAVVSDDGKCRPVLAATLSDDEKQTRTKSSSLSAQRNAAESDVGNAASVSKVDSENAWKERSVVSGLPPLNSKVLKADSVATAVELPLGDAKPTVNLDSLWGENVRSDFSAPQTTTSVAHLAFVTPERKTVTVNSRSPSPIFSATDDDKGPELKNSYSAAEKSREENKELSVASDNVGDDFSW